MSNQSGEDRQSKAEHSRLFYHGTEIEVQLGDRVKIRKRLRSDLEGTVCYIPGISPKHSELEYEDVKKWAIRLDNGVVLAMGYYPEQAQPKRNIIFLDRSDDSGITPETELC